MIGVLTPGKLANATNQDFLKLPKRWLLNINQGTTGQGHIMEDFNNL